MVTVSASVEPLVYKSYGSNFVKKALRAFSPRLVRGVHYAYDGPVHRAVQRVGNLTAIDFMILRLCNLLGMPNARLENKLRAIGNAFQQEAELLELSGV